MISIPCSHLVPSVLVTPLPVNRKKNADPSIRIIRISPDDTNLASLSSVIPVILGRNVKAIYSLQGLSLVGILF